MANRAALLERKIECARIQWARLKVAADVCPPELIADHNAVEQAEMAWIDAQLELDAEQAKTAEPDALVSWMLADLLSPYFKVDIKTTRVSTIATVERDSDKHQRQFVLRDGRFVDVPSGEIVGPH